MFISSRRRVLAFLMIIAGVMIIGLILTQNGLRENVSVGIGLLGLTILALAYALIQSKTFSLFRAGFLKKQLHQANPPPLGSGRDEDHAPSGLFADQARVVPAPSLEIASPESIGMQFISESQLRKLLGAMTKNSVLWIARHITSTRNSENRLGESEERFRSLIEKSTDVISILDANGKAFYRTPSAVSVTGYSDTERAANDMFALIHPEDLAKAQKLFETIRRAPLDSVTVELRFQHKNGSWRWLKVTATNHLADPSIRGIVVNYIDITEAKARTEEIQRRHRDLKVLFQIGQSLSRLAPLSETLENVFAAIGQALDNRNLYIALYDQTRREINFPIYTMAGERLPPSSRALDNGITEYILRTKVPLFLPRNAEEGLKERGIDLMGPPTRSFLGVPMLAGGAVAGIIAIQDYQNEDAYTTHDLELLSTIASQVGSAIENARLYDQAQNRGKEFETLYQTTHTLALGSDLPAVLQLVIEQAAVLLNAPAGGILLYDAERNVLEFSAKVGLSIPIGTTLELNEGFVGQVFQTEQALIINDYGEGEPSAPQSEKFNLHAMIGVPLIYRGHVIGVLELGETGTSRRTFTESDQRLLALFAAQVAGAVHNARLLAETQQRAREFETLYQVTRDLNSYKDLPELLQTILDRATELFRTPSGSISLYDSARGNLRMAAVREFPIPIGTLADLGMGMAGIVSQKREPLIIANYSVWESRMPDTDGIPFNAALCVPMIYRGELIGTLAVLVHNNPARKFTEADARLLSLFASHAASAVYETRLFEETRTRADQLALLYDAGLTLNRVLDPKLQLEFLLKLALQTLKADRAIFYRYDLTERALHVETAVGYDTSTHEKICALQFPQASGVGIPDWVLEHRLAVNLGRVTRDARYLNVDPEVQSGLWVPIEHESRPRGVLCVFSARPNAFTLQDERLLALYANQLSTAMGNAELFGDIKQRLSELEAINKLSTTLRAARSRAEMLPLFLHQTLALFETNAGVIWLYNRASHAMEQVAASGWFGEIHEKSMGPQDGIAGQVFSSGKLHFSREFLKDPLTPPSTREQIPGGWGGVCVPIRSAEGIVGVLFIAVPLPRQLNEPEARLLTTLAEIAGNTIHRMHLHESMQKTFVETVAALAHAIDARDAYTAGHSNNVSDLAVELAAEVGLPSEECETIRLAGLLHDIGKIAIPDAILHKSGRLTPEEYALVKTHPKVGAQILESIQQLKPVVPIVLSHQERFDGTGYPNGLARKEIPMGARVLSVVDAYSAITDRRAYRPARSKAYALEEIERWSGKQFDPEIVLAFLKLVSRKN